MVYIGVAILLIVMIVMIAKKKSHKKKKKRIGCPTCSPDGRCTQACKTKLGDFY
jgi:hypothetical protein